MEAESEIRNGRSAMNVDFHQQDSVGNLYLSTTDYQFLGEAGVRWGVSFTRNIPLTIDAKVEVVPEILEAEKEQATFNFFCLPQGYGWIFPKTGYLSCGVGSWSRNHSLPKAMDDFLAKSFPAGSIRSVKRSGHPIPIYAGHREIATQRVCLVGDAANLVDPIMGEGIRFALESGSLAAEIIKILLTMG